MIEIFGEIYYIDFDVVDLFLGLDTKISEVVDTQTTKIMDETGKVITTEVVETKLNKPREINGVRYDLIKGFIDDISSASHDDEGKIGGVSLSEMSIGVRLAFNTLTAYGILKPIED